MAASYVTTTCGISPGVTGSPSPPVPSVCQVRDSRRGCRFIVRITITRVSEYEMSFLIAEKRVQPARYFDGTWHCAGCGILLGAVSAPTSAPARFTFAPASQRPSAGEVTGAEPETVLFVQPSRSRGCDLILPAWFALRIVLAVSIPLTMTARMNAGVAMAG